MPFIWNDKTFGSKIINQCKRSIREDTPLMIIFAGIFYFMIDGISLIDLFLISTISSIWVISSIDLYRQPIHWRIPDTYSKEGRTSMFIGMWIIISIGLLFFGNYIIHKYGLFV